MPGLLARVGALIVAAVTSFAAAWPASAAKRIALVVGNDAYQTLTPLRKAVNDARAVKGALAELGFTVIAGENLTRREMNQRLAELETVITPGDQVFVFYAGHGVAIGAENYLLPVDMPVPQGGQEGLVRNEGHSADAIIRSIQGKGAATTFVVLDACRNNPISDKGTRNVGLDRGLARMDAPTGVFVLFSAGIGQTALDRLSEGESEPNSVFTRKLVPLLRRPGLSHIDLAKELQQEVSALAATIKHRQEPAYYDQIIGRVVLKEGAPVPAPGASAEDVAGLKAEIEALKRKQAEQQANLAPPPKPESLKPEAKPEPAAPAPAPPASSGSDIGPGTVFRDCPECPEMTVVPAGSFTMGSPAGEEGRDDDEGPQRKVTISKPFAVGKFEVTRDEFEAFVKATGHNTGDKCWAFESNNGEERSGRSFRNPGYSQGGTHPVVCVNWDDAKAYVAWLSQKTGKGYRLLTEAEWEYATRAGTTTRYSYGNGTGGQCGYANGADQTARASGMPKDLTYASCKDGYERTAPAGSFKPNTFGLFDMHGNVLEWVEDCYKDSYQGVSTDGSASTSGDCSRRVLRGGSWDVNPRYLRSATRYWLTTDNRSVYLGFRVGRTL